MQAVWNACLGTVYLYTRPYCLYKYNARVWDIRSIDIQEIYQQQEDQGAVMDLIIFIVHNYDFYITMSSLYGRHR